MHGHKYNVGDRVYRVLDVAVDASTKGTVINHAGGEVVYVLFDCGNKWHCTRKSIKPLVRVVG